MPHQSSQESQSVDAMSQYSPSEPLRLSFAGSLVEELGAKLYPSATATVAELISNSWDADAKHVWVTMPFTDWLNGSITVVDDGVGMTRQEAAEKYLVIGRHRRNVSGDRTIGGRLVHGRKGIGKLAAFGTAGVLELATMPEGGELETFKLDYDTIRKMPAHSSYTVELSDDTGPLVDDNGEPLSSGTRIRLSNLRLKRTLNEEEFILSMSRRFSLDKNEMQVYINRKLLPPFTLNLDIVFPRDGMPLGASLEPIAEGDDSEGPFIGPSPIRWAVETLPDGSEVKWWVGFTESPLKGEAEQGISVLARGKLAQRPFKFERFSGTTGQLGQEYLVGEVKADWLDREAPPIAAATDVSTGTSDGARGHMALDRDSLDADASTGQDDATEIEEPEDLIQSNRDGLQLENESLAPFLEWGRSLLRWSLAQRSLIKRERVDDDIAHTMPGVRTLLESMSPHERFSYQEIAKELAAIPEVGPRKLEDLMRTLVRAKPGEIIRSVGAEIDLVQAPDDEVLWDALSEAQRLAGHGQRSLLSARAKALEVVIESLGLFRARARDHVEVLTRNIWVAVPWVSELVVQWSEYDRSRERVQAILSEPGPNPSDVWTVLVACLGDAPEPEGLRESLSSVIERANDLRTNVGALDAFFQAVLVADDVAADDVSLGENPLVALQVRSWDEAVRHSLDVHRLRAEEPADPTL